MYAVIYFPQFSLQAALRHAPELWSQPVALVDPTLNTPRVCDRTAPARRHGVEPGLTPTQALARCRDIVLRSRVLAHEEAALEAILQCAYAFSPHIESTAAGTVTLDLRGLSELHEANARAAQFAEAIDVDTAAARAEAHSIFHRWAQRLRQALIGLCLTARLGIGSTPNIARHAAQWEERPDEQTPPNAAATNPSDDGVLRETAAPTTGHNTTTTGADEFVRVVLDAPTFVGTLPVAALDPSTDVAEILHKWGVHTVGQLLALGTDAVMDRLGLEAIALFAAASTRAVRPLNLVRPAGRYFETFEFEHEIETTEPLLFILNRFVDQIAQRLEPAGFAAELLILQLQLESGQRLERRLHVPQPTRRSDILFRMLQTHLESFRTDSAIVGVSLEAVPTRPAQKQFSLFEAALRDPHQFQETLARLSALVGSDRVGTPIRENSHRPDAFKLIPPDFENAPLASRTPTPELLRPAPLRRLRPGLKARVETTPTDQPKAANQPQRPSAFRATPVTTNIVELIGPLFSQPKEATASTAGNALAASRSASAAPSSDNPATPSSIAAFPASTQSTPQAPITSSNVASGRPLSLRCRLASGRLSIALGPWRASGQWWEPGAWQREEWDVQTRDGEALRLVHQNGEWRVEAIVD